jgi:hypothetical protein
VALGDNNQAITWAQKAYRSARITWVYLQTEPLFDSLRADTRFQHLMQLIGSATKFLQPVFYTLGAPRDPAKKNFLRDYSFCAPFPPLRVRAFICYSAVAGKRLDVSAAVPNQRRHWHGWDLQKSGSEES